MHVCHLLPAIAAYLVALKGEHDDDGVDEPQQCHRPKVGHEPGLKTLLADGLQQGVPRGDAGREGDAQEEQHAARDLPEADVQAALHACPPRDHLHPGDFAPFQSWLAFGYKLSSVPDKWQKLAQKLTRSDKS